MTRPTNPFAFVRALIATNLRSALALRGAFVVQAAFMALNNFVYFIFWWALMQHVDALRGWRLADIELLYGIVAAAVGLTVAVGGGVRYLGQFIEDGDLDTLLTQPQPVLVHAALMRSQPAGFGDFVSGLIFVALSGRITWSSLPLIAAAVAASAVVFLATGIVFFSLAFWLGRIDSVARQLWELTITFSLYPEPLFGGVLRFALFTILPAGFIGYLPARVVLNASFADVALLATGACAYLAAAALIFDRGLRRYASGSRFSTFG